MDPRKTAILNYDNEVHVRNLTVLSIKLRAIAAAIYHSLTTLMQYIYISEEFTVASLLHKKKIKNQKFYFN